MGKPPLDIAEYIRQAEYWKGKAMAAEAELAELRKDKARLDWAEEWMPEIMCRDMGKHMEIRVTYYAVPHPSAARSVEGDTIRAAIDAAMKEVQS